MPLDTTLSTRQMRCAPGLRRLNLHKPAVHTLRPHKKRLRDAAPSNKQYMRFCAAIGASGSGTRQDTLQKRDLPRLARTAPSAEKREEIAEMMRAASGIFWRGQKRLAPVLQTPNPSSSTQALRPQKKRLGIHKRVQKRL